VTDAIDKDYEVTPGTYSVAETVPTGWDKTGDTCQNVVVAAGATVTCLLTNTKRDTVPPEAANQFDPAALRRSAERFDAKVFREQLTRFVGEKTALALSD